MVIRTSDVYQDSEQHRCGHNQGYLGPRVKWHNFQWRVTLSDTDSMTRLGDDWSGFWRVLWCVSVCVLLNVALYSSPHSRSWVSPSSSDILNCNPLMSHKMYWLGNEGTSYTLLTTTLISSGSSAGLASKITHRHFIQRACLSCCNKLWLHSVNFISRIFPN